MKVTPLVSALLVLTGIFIFSCKKHTAPTSLTIPVIPAGMSVTYHNGGNYNTWMADTSYAFIDTIDSVVILNIYGSDSNDGGGFELTLPYYNYKTGVYNINNTYSSPVVNFYAVMLAYQSISGNITLTQISANNIQGTFNCVFSNNDGFITNGQFNVPMN